MSHLVRQEIPRKWPVERKGSVYVVRPQFQIQEGMPILVVLRDVMGLAQNRREVKRIIHNNQIILNGKIANDEKQNILLFDTLNIVPLKKCYKLILNEKGKFEFEEIAESKSDKKIAKVIGKKILKGKKIQVNLSDGRNFLSDTDYKTNDSVVINLKTGKAEKILPLKEGVNVAVFSGKHVGKTGKILSLDYEKKMAKIKYQEQEINILINQLMVVE